MSGLDPLNCRPHQASSPSLGAAPKPELCKHARTIEVEIMDASVKVKQLGDIWNWVVIGLTDAAVTMALFVAYI